MERTVILSGIRAEAYEYERPFNQVVSSKRGLRVRRAPTLESRRDNVRRARDNFRRLVCSNLVGGDAPAFLSLTFYHVIGVQEAYSYLSKFIKRIREHGYPHIRYISVPEYQQRGTIHFHALVWGLPDSVILGEGSRGKGQKSKKRWLKWCRDKGYTESDFSTSRNLQRSWQQGYCDITPTDGNGAIASYMAKYLSKAMLHKRFVKDFEDSKGLIRMYSASRNVLRPLSLRGTSADIAMEYVVGYDTPPVNTRRYDTEFRGNCVYSLFDISNNNQEHSVQSQEPF